ncbi:MAG: Gfo/Idh/MocA family protein [Verrucomicrobiota bacterium]
MNDQNSSMELNRRNFIGSFSSLMMLMGGVAITPAQEKKADEKERYAGPPVNCAVIGCGFWGREIIGELGRQSRANLVGVCDTYPAYLKRSAAAAPKAQKYSDYRQVLDQKDIHAVIVATPTHLHKQIVLDALQAGKHVYCEAPLAHTVDDARAIAKAAAAAKKLNFQAGLQQRSDPELIHILNFVRAGAAGTPVMTRAQWHKKTSWRRSSANPDFEKALNWRLDKQLSIGLVGELGIHNIDAAGWFMNRRPAAVTGFGSIIQWNDGREIPDTVQAVVDYNRGARLVYDATLANSFDSTYDTYYGTDATVMIRDRRGWMFKEVDSPLLGWEVYARKESFFKEVGIVLAANATKLAAQGENPTLDTQTNKQDSLYYALEAFLNNTSLIHTGVEDFTSNYGSDDENALQEYLADILKARKPAADWKDGYDATVTVIKSHEAIMKGTRIELPDELYNIA